MMDFNEETDILDRLGILDSKLVCPNKQFPMAKGKEKSTGRDTNLTSCSMAVHEAEDWWGGFSLDELSSSSDDSEFLFDRRDLISPTDDRIHRRFRHQNQGRYGHQYISRTGTPNLWKLFALLSVASFAGFSMTLSHVTLSFSSSNEQNIPLFYLLQTHGIHAIVIWVGSVFVSSILLKTNPFSIFFTLMLIFMFICAQIRMAESVTDSQTIGKLAVLFLCVSQAFVEGAIQRGLFLLSPLWTVRSHRVLFLCYAAMAFSAGCAFHLQHIFQPRQNLSTQEVPPDIWALLPFSGNSTGFARIERLHRQADIGIDKDIPTFLGLNLNNTSQQHHIFSSVDNGTSNLSTNNDGDEKKSFTESAPKAQQSPMFKTKTEENAFRRKEVEQKRKKEQEEEEQKKKKEQEEEEQKKKKEREKEEEQKKGQEEEEQKRKNEKEKGEQKRKKEREKEEEQKRKKEREKEEEQKKKKGQEQEEQKRKKDQEEGEQKRNKERTRQKERQHQPASTFALSTFQPGTKTTELSPKRMITSTIGKTVAKPPSGVLFPTSILVGLCLFILPILSGFCCCCAIDHPICSTQYRHLDELLSTPSAHSDPLSCNLLSMAICALHSALIAMLQFSLAIFGPSFAFASVSISSSSLFWIFSAFNRLIFVLMPSLASKSSSLHCLYFVSLLFCSALRLMPLSNPFSQLLGVAFLGFSSANIPLLLYVWHCSSSLSSSFLSDSGRFIASMAFGNLVGPMVFVWWNDNGVDSDGNIPRSSFKIPAVFYFGFGILVLSYVLFLLLLAKLRRSQRQQQISQLSGALNGNAQKRRKTPKASNGRTKGPYKALFFPAAGDESNDTNFAQNILDDSEGSQESEEVVDLEMDSLGGDEEIDRGQRMDRKDEEPHSLV